MPGRRSRKTVAHSARPYDAKTRITTLEIDETKFDRARAILGTATLRETVDRSFDEVVARAAREKSIRQLQRMDGLDLRDRKIMKGAWRS